MDFIRNTELRELYPTKIPVIVKTKNIELSKNKFLVSNDICLGAFIAYIRQRHLKISNEQGIVIFIGNVIPKISETMSELDDKYGDKDMCCLNLIIAAENTFG